MKISHFRYWLSVSNHLYSNIPEVLNNEQINIGFFCFIYHGSLCGNEVVNLSKFYTPVQTAADIFLFRRNIFAT